MLDINGQELVEGGMAMLLCEILEIEPGQVRIRIMNSDMELAVGAKQDEVLGGMVADSELTAFVEQPRVMARSEPENEPESESVPVSQFE
jgi:hypothetical protein